MTSYAALRIGSLEIVAALAAFAVVAARLQPGIVGDRRLPRALQVRLRIREAGGRPARDVALALQEGAPAVIGRSSQAQVGVSDAEVSRRHAQVELERGVLYLADCGSSNGTFLNGKPVDGDGIELRAGDDIDVGNTRISVVETEPLS
ncbi:MAG TPA: FHA domain-containing protein [Candidatus Baltobacteraceae bacterium]|nr:FHA domain-containing protein [Candidatus Baltobacteraceae bacterium]